MPRPKLPEEEMNLYRKKVERKRQAVLADFIAKRESIEDADMFRLSEGEDRIPAWLPTMDTDKMRKPIVIGFQASVSYYRQFSSYFEGTQQNIFEALLDMVDKDSETLSDIRSTIEASDFLTREHPELEPYADELDEDYTFPMANTNDRMNAAYSLISHMAGDHWSDRPLVSAEAFSSLTEEEKEHCFSLVSKESLVVEGLAEYGITPEQFLQVTPIREQPEQIAFRIPDHPDINSQTYSAHFEKGKSSLQEMKYGEDVFDYTFAPIYKNQIQKAGMKAAGINQYDLIFINGKSVNELYGERFKDLNDRQRNAMLQTSVVAAALDGKSRVECCRLQREGDKYVIAGAMTMKPQLELHEPKLNRWSRFKQALHIEPKTIPKAKQLEDLAKTDFKAGSRRERIAAKTEEWFHKLQEKRSARSKTTISELTDDKKKERRMDKTAEKAAPEREKGADKGRGK